MTSRGHEHAAASWRLRSVPRSIAPHDPADAPAVPSRSGPTRRGASDESPPDASRAPALAADARIEAFFDTLVGLLAVGGGIGGSGKAADASAIREELEEHVRERVRDLVVEGLSEAGAVDRALGELGEAAALAQRFNTIRGSGLHRRLAMNAAVIMIAGAALVVSIGALVRGAGGVESAANPPGLSGLQPLPTSVADGSGMHLEVVPQLDADGTLRTGVVLRDIPIIAHFFNDSSDPDTGRAAGDAITVESHMTWRQVLDAIHAGTGMAIEVRPEITESTGLGGPPNPGQAEEPLRVTGREIDIASVLSLVNASQGITGSNRLDHRFVDGDEGGAARIVIATQRYFDVTEAELVCYDIRGLLESGIDEDEFRGLISSFVEPDAWEDNGGDAVRMRIVGGRMFLKAPPRVHRGVKWFAEQLGSGVGEGNPQGNAGNGAVPSARSDSDPQASDAPGPGGGELTLHLRHARAAAVRELMGLVFDVSPLMRKAGVREVGVDESDNTVRVWTSGPEADAINALAAAIDQPGDPHKVGVEPEVQTIALRHVATDRMMHLLDAAARVCPQIGLDPLGVSVTGDPMRNSIIVRSSRPSVDLVARIVDAIDRE